LGLWKLGILLRRGKIENANQQAEIASLYQISQIASKAENLDGLWQPLFDEVLKIMAVDAGTIMILEGDFLVRKIARGLGMEIMKEPPLRQAQGGISWKAVQTRKPVVENDLAKAQIASKALAAGQFHSLITVPMITRDQVVGVISIFTRKERNFTDKDLSLFSVIANQSALAIISIQSAKLLSENRKRLGELAALNQISQSVATLFNFEETLFSIIGLITRQLGGDKGVLTLFDHREKLLKAASPAFNLRASQVRDFRARSDEGATGQAFCKGVPILVEKIDPETAAVLTRAKIVDVKSMLVAPLKVKSQTLGVFHVFSAKENNFRDEDLKLFSILTSQAAVVVNSAYIYRQIEEERKKDEALLSSIGEGVLAVDKEENIILLNKSGEKITGFLEEELIGKPASIIGVIASEAKQSSDKIAASPESLKAAPRNDIKRRDGTTFPARISSAATRDADDKIIGAIVVFSDITHDLEVEQMKQELISIATHELRTPITGIKGYLDMILAGDTGELNAETKETLQETAGITQKLADLVDDLLNVGRIEQGRIEVKPVAMDLAKLISDVIKEISIQAKQKNLELVMLNASEASSANADISNKSRDSSASPQNDKIMVKADPDRTRQVLINLIGNAIKYTEKGSVTVSIGNSSRVTSNNNNYSSSGNEKSGQVITHVQDTGLGMSKEGQEKLFSKFYRVKTEKTRSITGTGLGLWITKQIVELMGGKIWVESVEGKGSTFSFSLPIS